MVNRLKVKQLRELSAIEVTSPRQAGKVARNLRGQGVSAESKGKVVIIHQYLGEKRMQNYVCGIISRVTKKPCSF